MEIHKLSLEVTHKESRRHMEPITELGLPALQIHHFFGLYVPAGTPAAVEVHNPHALRMVSTPMLTSLDPARIFLKDLPWTFLGEVALRSVFAYCAVFVFLKLSGRRGIRQLSLFELVVILTLGSAAGDVSFYEDVPLLPVTMVFLTLLALYRLTTFATAHSKKFETWMDGKPVTVIEDGLYKLESLEGLNMSSSELFMELRQQGVEHLGQVRLAILEIDGEVSLYFFEPEDVQAGLSVLPPEHRQVVTSPPSQGLYCCVRCGMPRELRVGTTARCARCDNDTWTKALTTRRPR
ncbi:DUF421 domain-containing protein [Pseudorhodoferax sp. Leaf274]|uniref:DUF421 domain-containing protein n=1 Tax=Pseudorhodoferax sp. Leaf274 TaxID=1736318 RepID=UPI001910DB7D|nr:DUF421 domain-containing protein [Pseudorhodoferax sp. Leaf274]